MVRQRERRNLDITRASGYAFGMRPGAIVTIGGGELSRLDTLAIDEEIVRLTGRDAPRALFLPTASSDADAYVDVFRHVYGGRLGLPVEVLRVVRESPSPAEIRRAIGTADLIYVGGGNTLGMLRIWRRLGIDRLLVRAWRTGAVLCGLSAGAICWYDYGHSDSRRFYTPESWSYMRVRGLGLLRATACPHYDGERRDESFRALLAPEGELGIAMDDCAALVVHGGNWHTLVSRPSASVYRVYGKGGRMITERLDPSGKPAPAADLFRIP